MELRYHLYHRRWFRRMAVWELEEQYFHRLSGWVQLVYRVRCIFSDSYWRFSWHQYERRFEASIQ